MTKTIGIDFGTTTSSVAYHDGVSVRFFETPQGHRIMPSAVAILEGGRVHVGDSALNELAEHPQHTFLQVKRSLGEAWNDLEMQGYNTVESVDGWVAFAGPDRNYSAVELTAKILEELKAMAEDGLGERIDGAVITVPADCSETQRRATIEAAGVAGFDEKRVTLFAEPHAAATAYGFDKEEFARLASYDLGGGTFDIALMNVRDSNFEEVGALNVNNLGGADFDERISNYVIDKFMDEHREILAGEIHSAQLTNIMFQSERAKKVLSTNDETRIRATFVARDKDGNPLHLNHDLTVAEFEGLAHDYIETTIENCERCLKLAGKTLDDIDEVLLVGGMTRVPAVRRAVESFFGMPAVQRNPDTIVAEGAAIKAAQIDGRISLSHQNTTTASYGLQNPDGTVCKLIPRGTKFGFEKSFKLTTAQDGQSFIRVALVRGDEDAAELNELISIEDAPVKPGKAGAATVPLKLRITQDGLLESHLGK